MWPLYFSPAVLEDTVESVDESFYPVSIDLKGDGDFDELSDIGRAFTGPGLFPEKPDIRFPRRWWFGS